jgi:hypothetical protein
MVKDRMATEENINFLDLACLFKVGDDTTLERFGSTINASVFDAANISGSLKQKGLIDFTPYYPGPNTVILTDAGKQLKIDAEAKGAVPTDALDDEILKQMSGGKRYPLELQNTLNIRPLDLAFRLYKLYKQNLMSYELKNGNVEIMLTEQGFLKSKNPTPMQAPPQAAPAQPGQQGAPATLGQQPPQAAAAQVPPEQIKAPNKRGDLMLIFALSTLVLIVAVAAYLHFQLQII